MNRWTSRPFCEQAEELLHKALEQLSFLEEYTFYVVKQINLRRRRISSPEYDHQCFLLQGESDFPVAANENRNWFTETNEALIYRSETSYLNVDPLFVYVHADEIDKTKLGSNKNATELYPGLYCFAGFSTKASGIVIEYLPCVGSSKSFRTSNEAFRDSTMTACFNQGIEELLQMLTKPVATTETTNDE